MTENFKIIYPESFYKNEKIEDHDLFTYAYMYLQAVSPFFEERYVTSKEVGYYMYGTKLNKETHTKIKKSLCNLFCFASHIKGKILDKDSYMINTSCFSGFKEKFVNVDFDVIRKINRSSYKYKYGLFRLYLLIMGSRKFKNGRCTYCDLSIDWFAECLNVSERTISRYISSLENLDIIYVFRDLNMHENNMYCAYEDRDYINDLAKSLGKRQDFTSNSGRSLMQKYHWIQRGKSYPQDEIDEVRVYIERKNKKNVELLKQYPTGDYPQYDVSILT